MAANKEDVLAAVVRVLGPYIGKNLASASARGHCEKFGFGPRLDDHDKARLLDALSPGLNVFVGKRHAQTIVDEMRSAIDTLAEKSR